MSVYRYWNDEEDAILIAAWDECKSLKEIAVLLRAYEVERGFEPYRTPDTVRMRAQTLRKRGHNLPIRPAALQRWREKHKNAGALQLLIEANRAEKERLRALREEQKKAKAAERAQIAWERIERAEKAAMENRKGWPREGVILFTDNLTEAELKRELMRDPGRIPFVGTAPFLAGRRAA